MSATLLDLISRHTMRLIIINELEGTQRFHHRTHEKDDLACILHVTLTLTFDIFNPKTIPFVGYSRSFPIPSLNTLGSFDFELCSGQTDKQTDGAKHSTQHSSSRVGFNVPPNTL